MRRTRLLLSLATMLILAASFSSGLTFTEWWNQHRVTGNVITQISFEEEKKLNDFAEPIEEPVEEPLPQLPPLKNLLIKTTLQGTQEVELTGTKIEQIEPFHKLTEKEKNEYLTRRMTQEEKEITKIKETKEEGFITLIAYMLRIKQPTQKTVIKETNQCPEMSDLELQTIGIGISKGIEKSFEEALQKAGQNCMQKRNSLFEKAQYYKELEKEICEDLWEQACQFETGNLAFTHTSCQPIRCEEEKETTICNYKVIGEELLQEICMPTEKALLETEQTITCYTQTVSITQDYRCMVP